MENCVLVDPFTGKGIVRLTRQEAESMVSGGTAERTGWRGKKTGTHRYRLVVPVAPSNSLESSSMLTAGDIRALVAVLFRRYRISIEQAERLVGWGFRIERAFCDACEESVRMPHLECI
jgi:hypothetical protein